MTQAQPSDAKAIANEFCAPISWAVLIVALIFNFLFCWWMIFGMEWLWQIYTDMNIPGGLPPPTLLLFRFSFGFASLVALAGIAGLVKEFLIHDRRVTLIINTVHIVFLTLFHQIFLAVMYLPLFKPPHYH